MVIQVDSLLTTAPTKACRGCPNRPIIWLPKYAWPLSVGTVTPRIRPVSSAISVLFRCGQLATSGLWKEDEQFDLSARLNWVSPDEQWVGALYVTISPTPTTWWAAPRWWNPPASGAAVATPRMYGVELECHF